MSRNRVEELETKVAELESTVTGLTEELVEAKERIRDLEAELEPEPADGSQFPDGRGADRRAAASGRGEAAQESVQGTAQEAARGAAEEAGPLAGAPVPEGTDGDTRSAEEASGRGAPGECEGDKGEAPHSEDETDSGPGDDIIVA